MSKCPRCEAVRAVKRYASGAFGQVPSGEFSDPEGEFMFADDVLAALGDPDHELEIEVAYLTSEVERLEDEMQALRSRIANTSAALAARSDSGVQAETPVG